MGVVAESTVAKPDQATASEIRGTLARAGAAVRRAEVTQARRARHLGSLGSVLAVSEAVMAHLDQVIAESEAGGFCCLED